MDSKRVLELYRNGNGYAKIASITGYKFNSIKSFLQREKGRAALRGEKLERGMDAAPPVSAQEPRCSTAADNVTEDAAAIPERSSVEYKADGTIISEKFITLRDGEDMTPAFIIKAHGLDPGLWEVVSYRNNYWNSQLKGGVLQISYQSRLTARPIKNGIDLAEVDKHFKELDRECFVPPVYVPRPAGTLMAEVNIADLHVGKLAWHGETPENFDHKIARDLFYQLISEIVSRIKGLPLEYITFVWANDFFNADTIQNTTTGATPQDVDVRWQKMFNVGVEMLVRGIGMLEPIAPVRTFYTPSNHDMVNGYHALKYLEAWYRADQRVYVDPSAQPRWYQLYGTNLIGYCHGDKEDSRATKEKASRLASLMPIEVPELWAKSRCREFHTAHLHSEQMIQEINGVIVRRISSPTAADAYHTTHGYLGAIRKAQTFIYDKERGLMQTINTPVN
jgi:hypothetical protein